MSEFQNYATNIIIPYVFDSPMIDQKNSYWVKERAVRLRMSYVRQDIFAHIQFKYGGCRDVCIEIKSGSPDFNSGNGMNFIEDYNFLLFEVGHGKSTGVLRTKHLKSLEYDIGILAINRGKVFCVRPALPKSVKDIYSKYVFSLGFGERVHDIDHFYQEIDGVSWIA